MDLYSEKNVPEKEPYLKNLGFLFLYNSQMIKTYTYFIRTF